MAGHPGFLILAYLFIVKLMGESIGGRPLLIIGVMLVLMGMTFVAAGLIGELLTRIYYESGGGRQYYADDYVIDDSGETPRMVRQDAHAARMPGTQPAAASHI